MKQHIPGILLAARRSLALTIALLYMISPVAYGLSSEQKRVIDSGALHFNVEATNFCQTTTPSTPLLAGTVYVLGDSITHSARSNIETLFPQSGFTIASINSDPGRAISLDTAGNDSSGLAAVDDDKETIAKTDLGAVVIALGTNSGTEDLNVQIPALIQKVRSMNASVKIFWVNLFYTAGTTRDARNAIINSQASVLNYTVIDAASAGIDLGSDGVHPTSQGNTEFAATLVKGLKTTSGPGGQTGAYDPISLTYPAFPSDNVVATAITNYIRESEPNSPWFKVSQNIGEWLVREAKSRNINPLLVVAIGKQENAFGSTTQKHVTQYHNYFGMKGNSPINIPDSDYRGFSSPIEGMTFFLDKIKSNILGPDRGLYKEVVNFYDYLGMHQAGRIVYPGESLGPENGGMDGYDPSMRVYISWTTTDHPNNIYDGQLFNPGIYYTNSINVINELTGANLSTTPSKGPTTPGANSNCSQTGSGIVNTNGYSFPLAPQRKIGYSTLPCKQPTCHHDGTPAFDLSYADVTGKSVYAIIGGTIDKINTQDPGWCQSIQLKGSDGYYYWYGHVINVGVSQGQSITAGQELGKVAAWSPDHTCDGTSSGPHLHIDRGCTINGVPQRGGNDACRDPEFIPFLDALYETLPS